MTPEDRVAEIEHHARMNGWHFNVKMHDTVIRHICEAVAQERERCAQLAVLTPTPPGVSEADTIRFEIAAAIRAG